MSDSFNAFKLHSLATTTPNSSLNFSTAPPKIIPFCICTHCTNLISLNHHLGEEGGSTRRGLLGNSQQSSRWSPTPAQLLVLEELYRQGTKTPTAEQIQQIASQLRRFGKIEGKNVFYWFQNHKARERQKRRRREMEETANSDSAEDKEMYAHVGGSEDNNNNNNKQEAAGLRGTGYEVKETKKWASTSNCSALAEEPASQLEIAESGPNGWTRLGGRGMQVFKGCTSTSASDRRKSFQQNHDLPYIFNRESCIYCEDEEHINSRTLELFPLRRDDQDVISLNEGKSRYCASASEATATQFFEFLPLKD